MLCGAGNEQIQEKQKESTQMEVEGIPGYHGDNLSSLGVGFLDTSTSLSGVNFFQLLPMRESYV